MLTNTEIEAIRKRAEEATEGEWRYVPVDGGPELVIVGESGNEYVGMVSEKTDAKFIAASREDIPKLLAEIERLNALINRVEEAVDIEELYENEAIALAKDIHDIIYCGGDSD